MCVWRNLTHTIFFASTLTVFIVFDEKIPENESYLLLFYDVKNI